MSRLKQHGFSLPHIVMVIALLGAISGVGYYVYSKNSNPSQSNRQESSETTSEVSTLPDDLSGLKSIDEIKTQAVDSLNGATILGIELEQEDSGLVYKVKLSDGRVLFYNAVTGEVTTGSSDDDEEDSDESIPADFVAGITVEQARTIALEKRAGKTIKKIELETEEGVQVFSVRFTDGGRVDVNAKTGEVVRVREPNEKSSSGSSSGSSDSGSSDDSSDDSSHSSSGSGSSGSSHDDDHDDDSSSSPTATPSPSSGSGSSASDIGEAAAKTIANGRLSGKTIEKVEIETEEGVKVYSVRYTDDSRVDVRASDGAILRVEE
jgi:uncharacterized membrane protein YkoI